MTLARCSVAKPTKLLTALLDGIQSSGAALVLRGEPGIGKSRLLAEAAALARDRDIAVLSTTGVQSEARLAFLGLHQLLRPLRARTADLIPAHRAALDAAFGLTDGPPAQELQIARLAAQGLSNREIGRQLYVSHRTVSTHVYRIFPKLGITARGELREALSASAGRR